MTLKDLSSLATFAEQATGETADPIQAARYEGMAQAFAFVLQSETEAQELVRRLAYSMQYGSKAAIAKYGQISA